MIRPPPSSIIFPYTTLFRSAFDSPSGAPSPRPSRRARGRDEDRKSTRLNSSHTVISYAVFCLKKKKGTDNDIQRLVRRRELTPVFEGVYVEHTGPFGADQRAWAAVLYVFFFNDTATTEIYTLSLHDALPISTPAVAAVSTSPSPFGTCTSTPSRSEEHTSELQSHSDLVCRLLLEKKKKN